MTNFVSLKCRDCGGPAHPATCCQYSETWITCARCIREVWAWVIKHTNSKGRRKGPNFYDHVNRVEKTKEEA